MASIGRLLVATPLYPPDIGGPATYSYLLEKELPSRGIPVAIVSFGAVRHLPKLVRHVAYLRMLLRESMSADVILALDPVSVGLPAYVASRIRKKRFAVKIVGDYAWEQGCQRFGVKDSLDVFIQSKKVPLMVKLLQHIQSLVARNAEIVIVPSYYLRDVVRSWGVPESRIRVVYNAIEERDSGTCPAHLSQTRRPRILSIGRLVPWKHVDQIIDAVERVTEQGIPATLVIVGSGPQEGQLRKRAEGSKAAAIFLGAQHPEDTQAILDDTDILVINSSYEGLSHVLIEGLVHGKAIIATDAGGNRELIQDGVNGILIPVADTAALTAAIVRIAEDSALRASLEEGARASRTTFSVERMIQGTIEALT